MKTALVSLCLCLLSPAFSTPLWDLPTAVDLGISQVELKGGRHRRMLTLPMWVPLPLPGRATGNCLGQHRILLKGCNERPGFYIFKYVYSFSTRRNQTQIKKEEADRQSTIPGHRLGEDNARQGSTDDRPALEQDDRGSPDAMEITTGLKPQNHSAPGVGGHTHGPRPGTGTGKQGHGGVGFTGPTLASVEGSGDLNLVFEVDNGVSIVPQGGPSGEAVNRSSVRSQDTEDGAPRGVPVEGAMTAGRERAHATGDVGDEGSGEATSPSQGLEGVVQGTGTGGANLTSFTEKMEHVQVDAKGVDEYTYIPDSGSVTVTRGKVGHTSFSQVSPDKDEEVNIFIGRAKIRIGEQETTQAGATVGSKDDGIPTVGTSSPLPRLAVTAAREGDDDDGIAAHRQPEGRATTATLSHKKGVTSSPGNGHPTGDDEDSATTVGNGERSAAPSPWRAAGGHVTVPMGTGKHRDDEDSATTVGDGQGPVTSGPLRVSGSDITVPVGTGNQEDDEDGTNTVGGGEESVTPRPWRVAGGHITVPLGTGNHGKDADDEVRGEGQRFNAGLGGLAVTTPRQRGSKESTATVPAKRTSIRPGATVASPGVSREDHTTTLGTAGGHKAGDKTVVGSRRSGEARPTAPQPRAEVRVRPGGTGLDAVPKTAKTPSPRDSWTSTEAHAKAGGQGGSARGRTHAAGVGGGSPPRAGPARGSAAASKGQEQGQGGEARAAVAGAGAGAGRLPGHHGRRLGAAAPGMLAALGRSRQVDQVKRADELHVRERAFYRLGGAGPGPHTGLGSADSSQSSEGEQGSRSDSRQTGLRPSGWGGHPHGRWVQGTL